MEDDDESIQPAEAARDRRRDRRAAEGERSGMRTGLAKQFKQVLDAQAKRAAEAERELEDLDAGPRTRSPASKSSRRETRPRQ